MKKIFFISLVILASALIVLSFFLPWARVATSVTGVAKELTSSVEDTPIAGKFVGKLGAITDAISNIGGDVEIKTQVSGYQIPKLVNNETSKVALSLAQIMFKSAEGVDKKSYLVYLLPVFAVICSLLALSGAKNKLFIVIMLIISGAVSIGGLYNLHTTDMSSAVVKITILDGLWHTMYSFLFIFFVALAWLILDRKTA